MSEASVSMGGRCSQPQAAIPPSPRPDQCDAIAAVARAFASGERRVQVVAASGTGKTLLSLWIAERLRSSTVVYFAPSLALIRQTAVSWFTHANADRPLSAIAVCSDDTVADDLPRADLPVPVTTDPTAVAAFFNARGDTARRVAFATYQSVGAVAEALARTGAPPELIICDEAHRIAGPEGKRFQLVLDDTSVPGDRRVFMTATPRIVAPHRRALREGEVPVVSMDDPTRFGHVAYALPFGHAISLGLLADYRIDVLAVRDADVRTVLAQLPRSRRMMHEDLDELAPAAATVRAFAADTFRHAFSFHHTTKAATRFANAVREIVRETGGPHCHVGTVFGTTPIAERDATLGSMLAAPRGVLASARALMEGIDAPSVDAVIFVDPKQSVVDIAQGIGRALRRDPHAPRKLAHVVVPVVVPDALRDEDVEQALDSSLWAPVWRVLSALAAHDDRLEQALALAAQARGRAEGTPEHRRRPEASDDGRVTVHGVNIPLAAMLPPGISVARFSHAIRVRAVETIADPFEYGFGRLQAYVRQAGNARPLRTYVAPDGFRLGEWVAAQRLAFRSSQLSETRARRLQRLREWRWSRGDDEFDRGLRMLQRFVRDHRVARVPYAYWDRSGFWLGEWAARQRALRHDGKLAPLRASALATLPGWRWDQRDPPSASTVEALREATDRTLLATIFAFAAHVPAVPAELLSATVHDAGTRAARPRAPHPLVDWLAREYAPALLEAAGERRIAAELRTRPVLDDTRDVQRVPYWLESARDYVLTILATEIVTGHAHLTWSSLQDAPGRALTLPATIESAADRAVWNARFGDPVLVGSADRTALACRTIAIAAATLFAVRHLPTNTPLDARAVVLAGLAAKARHDPRFARRSYYDRADALVARYLSDGARRMARIGAHSAAQAKGLLVDAMQRQELARLMRRAVRVHNRFRTTAGSGRRGWELGDAHARALADARRSAVFGTLGEPGPVRATARETRARAQSDAWRAKILEAVDARIRGLRGPRNRHYSLQIVLRWTPIPDGVRNACGVGLGQPPVTRKNSAVHDVLPAAFRLTVERTRAATWESRKHRLSPVLACPPQAAFAMDRARKLPAIKGAVVLACVPASPNRAPDARHYLHGVWLRLSKDGMLSLEAGLIELEHGGVALLTADEDAVVYGRTHRSSSAEVHYRESTAPWPHPVVLPVQFWSQPTPPPAASEHRRLDDPRVLAGTNASHRAIMPDGTVVMTRDERFAFNLAVAQEYAAQEHHLMPRKHEKPRGVNLYMWLQNQELRLRKGTLEPERHAALASIPEWMARVEERQVRPALHIANRPK